MGVSAPIFSTTIGVAILFTVLFSGRFLPNWNSSSAKTKSEPERNFYDELMQRKSCMLTCRYSRQRYSLN